MPYYLLRWNNRWTLDTLHHLRDKWRLTEDEYFQRQYTKQFLEWRRHDFLIHMSLLRWVPSWKLRHALEKGLSPLLSWAADVAAARHARRPERVRLVQPRTQVPAAVRAETQPTTRS